MALPSAERGRVTRERLLDAAAALIAEVGWGSVTTRLVAERAGVQAGLVHYHFSSLPALRTEAAVRVARRVLDEALMVLTTAPDVPSGIDRLLAALQPYTGTDPASLLMVEALLASTREERLRGELAAVLADARAAVAGWLSQHGRLAQADATAVVLTAALDGLVLHRAVDPSLDLASLGGPLRRLLTEAKPGMGEPFPGKEEQ